MNVKNGDELTLALKKIARFAGSSLHVMPLSHRIPELAPGEKANVEFEVLAVGPFAFMAVVTRGLALLDFKLVHGATSISEDRLIADDIEVAEDADLTCGELRTWARHEWETAPLVLRALDVIQAVVANYGNERLQDGDVAVYMRRVSIFEANALAVAPDA